MQGNTGDKSLRISDTRLHSDFEDLRGIDRELQAAEREVEYLLQKGVESEAEALELLAEMDDLRDRLADIGKRLNNIDLGDNTKGTVEPRQSHLGLLAQQLDAQREANRNNQRYNSARQDRLEATQNAQ